MTAKENQFVADTLHQAVLEVAAERAAKFNPNPQAVELNTESFKGIVFAELLLNWAPAGMC